MPLYPKKFIEELEDFEHAALVSGKTPSAGFKMILRMAHDGHPDLLKAMVANVELEPIKIEELVLHPGNAEIMARNKLKAYMQIIRLIRYQIEEEGYTFKV